MTTEEHRVFSLHRYFHWSSILRERFLEEERKIAEPSPDLTEVERWEHGYHSFLSDVGMYLGLWLGSLYVVCEGWQELGLSDPSVDALLASPHLPLLKRFRHGVFHFQKDFFDDRTQNFLDDPTTFEWSGRLSDAFDAWFSAWLTSKSKAPPP